MKYTLITGASGGIGYELAKKFAAAGNHLILVSRQGNMLQQIAVEFQKKYNTGVLVIEKDLGLPGAADEVYHMVREKSVTVNNLVHNAGFYMQGAFAETGWEKEQQLIYLQCINHIKLIKLFLPEMLKKNEGGILNVCSTGSFMPGPYNAIYCAAKSFLLSFSEALAEELKNTNIHVTALCPGATRTAFQDFSKRKNNLLTPVMDAQSVAETGYRAFIKGKRVAIPGTGNKMQVFMVRFLPGRLVTKLAGIFVLKTLE